MTSSHFQHAYPLEVYHQQTWSGATTGLGWLHLLSEEDQGHCPHLYMEMLEVQSPDEVQVPLLPLLSDHTLTLGTQPHNHSANGDALARQEVLTSLKRKAADQPLSATQNPISETFAETFADMTSVPSTLHTPARLSMFLL